MARMLETFPEITERQDGKYPWSGPEGWANGKVWQLEQGVDFDTKVSSFRQTCAKLAQRRNHKSPPRTASMTEGKKTFLVVQFFPNETKPGRRR